MESKEFLKKIKYAVLSVDDKADVILFGSRARGDNKPDSDWDILVLPTKKVDMILEDSIRSEVYAIELKYTQPISTIIVDRELWKKMSITGFYENVVKEGIVL